MQMQTVQLEGPIALVVSGTAPLSFEEELAEISDQIFGVGFSVLHGYMQLLQKMAEIYHWDMAKSGARSNEAQKIVGLVDSAISKAQAHDTNASAQNAPLPKEAFDYFKARPWLREGIEIDQQYNWNTMDSGYEWNTSKLHQFRAKVQNYSTNNSDQMSQDQSQTQRVMQTYNISISLVNSLQTLMGDMNKLISQSLRW